MNLDDDFNLSDFNFDDLNIDELSLVPMEPTAAPVSAMPAKPKAKFQIDTRHNERRCSADRRQSIRFEDDRRKGDRRGSSVSDPWAKTVDF
ncbi:hypothetical protein M2D07_028565 [Pseudomonas sp. BGr12]|uniref:hypothetical protein n=1 Tax=unclassified Pseudomonas TaxID=196821 RepID=UPI001783CDB1|nr:MULTISPECIES: hypothetical protein [unclassified Pseudomonas]MBD9573857.1 hypothetical protein [Pseudomonas sp. PDM23]MBD9671695.1 hypothetical protein [Pseudomonas sp. PDM21]MDL2431000.1 hypothetical protein [Pseudomonas sp. BJa5]